MLKGLAPFAAGDLTLLAYSEDHSGATTDHDGAALDLQIEKAALPSLTMSPAFRMAVHDGLQIRYQLLQHGQAHRIFNCTNMLHGFKLACSAMH